MPEYSSYTYNHPSILVRYPHVKRNELIAREVENMSPEVWLDYGAGDGAIVGNLACRGKLPRDVTCYEPEVHMRMELLDNINKLSPEISEYESSVKIIGAMDEIGSDYDMVTALEVLEHLPLPERIKFYQMCAEVLPKNAVCLIEVPIEFGPILLLKEFGRRFLKGRQSAYTFVELIGTSVFGIVRDVQGRYREDDERTFISPHHGFDLNKLVLELSLLGDVEEIVKSPFPMLPRWLNQAILLRFTIQVKDKSKIRKIILENLKTVIK